MRQTATMPAIIIEGPRSRSTQVSLLLGGLLIVSGGRLSLSPNSLLRFLHLLGVLLGPRGVLLGKGAVLGGLTPLRID